MKKGLRNCCVCDSPGARRTESKEWPGIAWMCAGCAAADQAFWSSREGFSRGFTAKRKA